MRYLVPSLAGGSRRGSSAGQPRFRVRVLCCSLHRNPGRDGTFGKSSSYSLSLAFCVALALACVNCQLSAFTKCLECFWPSSVSQSLRRN
jgi:hypothetical protein